eukprot:TRINITY_DN27218_c0_g1_i1.p1 TRINITY_DN27218_c0_g1~~TRINITY_DN27218_c0_g1_i1.p1  ORF type:complete len:253 (+),score=53.81 TRINITY_DN27218_c0_g1_i1:70-759(+)
MELACGWACISHKFFGEKDRLSAACAARGDRGVTSMTKSPLVICGPSGSGTSTIIKELEFRFPKKLSFPVTHTTRAPRAGEIDGVHYHFVNTASFLDDIADEKFVEYEDVNGDLYGTSWRAVDDIVKFGRTCVLDVDVHAVKSIKAAHLDCAPRFVFVIPPSLEELEARLRRRGTDSEESVQLKLAKAKAEIEYACEKSGTNFDYFLENDDLEAAVSELGVLLHDWCLR